MFEPSAFVLEHLLPHLELTPIDETVMLHITCSSRRMGLGDKMLAVARACAREVIIPEHIQCCGFAGDKGLMTPELNAAALASLPVQVPRDCRQGFSNSRTCEWGLASMLAFPITASPIWWIRRRDRKTTTAGQKNPAVVGDVKRLGRYSKELLRVIVRTCIEKADYPIPAELCASSPCR